MAEVFRDISRLVECRDLVRRIVRATVAPSDLEPMGSYRPADVNASRVLLDTLSLLDIMVVECGGEASIHYVDSLRRPRGRGLN